MSSKRDLMTGCFLALVLGACGGQSATEADLAEVEAAMAQSQDGTVVQTGPAAQAPASALEATMLSADAVAVGSAVAANGAVASPKPEFAAGDTVHASVSTAGQPAGAEVVAYWFAANGTSAKQERKPLPAGAQYVNFSFGPADGLASGRYTVQIDVADSPVGMAEFAVR